MRLSDIHSQDLLPRFAALMAWICQAFDKLIKHITGRTKAIDAPLTIEAIEALTDEELQAYYEQYGLAEYYPDLSRDNRNWMLFQMARMYHLMGTPKAVETLCQYIFDDLDLRLQVKDNLAYDEFGNLIASSLHDLFDVTIKPSTNNLPADAINRIFDNVCRFARNSQSLRNIIVEEPDNNHDLPVLATNPYGGLMSVSWFENDDICEDVTPPEPDYMDILLAFEMSGSTPSTVYGFQPYQKRWAGILSSEDRARLNAFGIQEVYDGYIYGTVGWNSNYTYEPLAIYKDSAGEQLVTEAMSYYNFYCERYTSTNECCIVCGRSTGFYPDCRTWKCRITKIS